MLADAFTKNTLVARRVFELFLGRGQRWKLVFDERFMSERRRSKQGLDRLLHGRAAVVVARRRVVRKSSETKLTSTYRERCA